VVATLNEQRKTAQEIAETEEHLAQVLSRLNRLRKQHEKLRERSSGLFERGLEGLEEELEPDDPRPMSEEQQLVGQAQSLGAFGVVDWEFNGVVPYGSAGVDPGPLDLDVLLAGGPSAGRGSSGETPPVSQGSGDS
jgi:hypothetical protein